VTLSPYLQTVVGLVLLLAGGDFLVRGASRMARVLGVSPLVVGLTVVAFGTSAPEAAVSVKASFAGNPGLALGNVVGSNIFNILFILGITALIAPIPVHRQLLRLDLPVMMAASLLVGLLSLNGRLGVVEGMVLLVALTAYVLYLARQGRVAPGAPQARGTPEANCGAPEARCAAPSSSSPLLPSSIGISEEDPGVVAEPAASRVRVAAVRGPILDLLLIAGGLAILVLGAGQLVEGAAAVARRFGASELVIGLTLVAAGTSLPEVSTSVIAAVRGEREIAVGNVVGSNIFNLLFVLGAVGAVAPGGIPVPQGALTFDIPVMAGVALACFPVFLTGWTVTRWEGGLFVLYYGLYLTLLLVDAAGHDARDLLWNAVLVFVLPLTAVTAFLGWWRGEVERRARRT
jgi:cation:H+ antiporter